MEHLKFGHVSIDTLHLLQSQLEYIAIIIQTSNLESSLLNLTNMEHQSRPYQEKGIFPRMLGAGAPNNGFRLWKISSILSKREIWSIHSSVIYYT